MKKRALRLLLGAGYVILLICLLLYQAGALGERREWRVATLTTLFLGVALAVVLALYFRASDQIRKQEQNGDSPVGMVRAAEGEQAGAEQETEKGFANVFLLENRSYEEIYAAFLKAMERYAVSERELEVAWLLYRGYTNRQIGEELYIAETTVKKHVSHIYQKMDVQSRKEFRVYVQNLNSVPPSPFQTDPPG